MTTEQWSEVKRVFGAVLEVAPGERARWLDENCPKTELRAEVESLLGSYEESTQFLEDRPAGQTRAIEHALSIPQAGQRVGDYLLEREIGRGGMGIVFEARHEGEGFEQRVALKLIRAGFGLEELAGRFKYERKILARLEHPGIARLLDGGSTKHGVPYLVMEFVEGLPIDQWCATRNPPIAARVKLMLQVLDAVAYAHQRLVIHRDLKPSNILVNMEGRPKLLDFGIAKVLSEENEAPGLEKTRTGRYLLTPEYASPEQIQGEPVTTASDIYSLGVLLYALLSSHRPFDVTGLPTLEAIRKVVETEPAPPSARAAGEAAAILRGDLDNIVLKCLRRDPQERYSSVRALMADLGAWLDGGAVSATAPTLRYRVGKWMRRNKVEAVVVGALVVSIFAGTVSTAWQARQAHLARLKAEARFREVQKLSRSLLFEIHESVRKLPGGMETRALILRRATEFLDGLAKDAGDDAVLKAELAEGYRKLGSLLGSNLSENLGRKQEAVPIYEKGIRLAEEAVAAQPGRFEPLAVLDGLLVETALLYANLERRPERQKAIARLEEVIRIMEREHANNAYARSSVAIDLCQLAMIVTSDKQYDRARELYARATAIFDSLPPELAGSERVRTQRGFAYKRLGSLQIVAGKLEEAESSYKKALEIDRQLIAEHPEDIKLRYDSSFSLSDLGLISRRRGKDAQAAEYYRQAVAIREEAYARDPKDQRVLGGLGRVNCSLALALAALKRFDEARNLAARCVHLRLEYAGRNDEPSACSLPAVAYHDFAAIVTDEAASLPRAGRAGKLQEARSLLDRAEQSIANCRGERKEFDESVREMRQRQKQIAAR